MVSSHSPDEGFEWDRGRRGETAVSAKLKSSKKTRYLGLFIRIRRSRRGFGSKPSDEIWGTWSERPLKMKPAIGRVVGS